MMRIHYAGPIRICRGSALVVISSGYAACCSGPRAYEIRAQALNTHSPEAVTCKRCIAAMRKHRPRDGETNRLAAWQAAQEDT